MAEGTSNAGLREEVPVKAGLHPEDKDRMGDEAMLGAGMSVMRPRMWCASRWWGIVAAD
jgi:hypothetical protein